MKSSTALSRTLALTFAIALVLAAFAPFAAAEESTWVGWITDEACGAKGANAEHKACAIKCHKDGLAYVFYNNADEKLYKVSDQEMAGDNLGYEVEVTGTLDGDTIEVASIAKHEGDDGMGNDGGGGR
jgi:hypothetical protein